MYTELYKHVIYDGIMTPLAYRSHVIVIVDIVHLFILYI